MSGVILMSQAIEGTEARKLEQEQQFEANIKLVHYVLRRRFPLQAKDPDLVQLGLIGLWKAVQRFDPARETTFSTYAVPTIWGIIKYYQREEKHLRRKHPDPPVVSLDAIMRDQHDDGDPRSYMDLEYEQPGPSVEEDALSDIALQRLFAGLKERHRLVAFGLLEGWTQRQIGALAGISQAQVSRIKVLLRRKFGPRPKPRTIKPCDPPAWSPDSFEDPEPDPAKRGNLRWIQIASPHDQIQIKPAKKRRQSRAREQAKALLAAGITDPWEIAARLGVGVEAARRWIKILEEESHG
jgi:RNA polymerase sigma factor (sigma-70 family)